MTQIYLATVTVSRLLGMIFPGFPGSVLIDFGNDSYEIEPFIGIPWNSAYDRRGKGIGMFKRVGKAIHWVWRALAEIHLFAWLFPTIWEKIASGAVLLLIGAIALATKAPPTFWVPGALVSVCAALGAVHLIRKLFPAKEPAPMPTNPPRRIGDLNTFYGAVTLPEGDIGSGNTFVGPTNANGDTIIGGGTAAGLGAQTDANGVAIGAYARSGNKRPYEVWLYDANGAITTKRGGVFSSDAEAIAEASKITADYARYEVRRDGLVIHTKAK